MHEKDDRSLVVYLREIAEIPLLTPEEEIKQAKLAREGDKAAANKLVQSNLRFVVAVAKQYQHCGLSLNDLINEGNMGLIKAAERFDETKGFKFISYAVWWIRQSILQALAEQSRVVRLPLSRSVEYRRVAVVIRQLTQELGRKPTSEEIAAELDGADCSDVEKAMLESRKDVSLDHVLDPDEYTPRHIGDYYADHTEPSPDQQVIEADDKKVLLQVLDTLPAMEAEVIKLYFGIGQERSRTLEEVGDMLNLTRERVRQIHERAMRRLRHHSRSQMLDPDQKVDPAVAMATADKAEKLRLRNKRRSQNPVPKPATPWKGEIPYTPANLAWARVVVSNYVKLFPGIKTPTDFVEKFGRKSPTQLRRELSAIRAHNGALNAILRALEAIAPNVGEIQTFSPEQAESYITWHYRNSY